MGIQVQLSGFFKKNEDKEIHCCPFKIENVHVSSHWSTPLGSDQKYILGQPEALPSDGVSGLTWGVNWGLSTTHQYPALKGSCS